VVSGARDWGACAALRGLVLLGRGYEGSVRPVERLGMSSCKSCKPRLNLNAEESAVH
jgi:hypothetical protein